MSPLDQAQSRPESFSGHVRAWVAEEAHYMPFGKRLLRSLLGGVADWGPVRSYLDHLFPEHCRNCGARNADELVSRRVLNRRSGYSRGVSGRQRTTRELWEYRYRCQACGHIRREERTAAYHALINPR